MGLGSIFGSLIEPITEIIGKAVVDKDKKMELQFELEKLLDQADARYHEQMIAQTEVNKVEAAHKSVFVAGWRPAIGWGCGAALVYNTLIAPLFGTGVADLAFLQTILMGMLGIAGMRSFEKAKEVATDSLSYPETKPGFPKSILPDNIPWIK